MEWFTTNEAAEALKISSTRVRQLVQKHKSNKELVKSTKKKTRTIYSVSTKFIEVCQTNRANFNDNLLKVGEPIEQPNGTIIEVFTAEQYDQFEKQLKDYHTIKKELEEIEVRFKEHIADLRNERNYLRNH